MMNKMLKTIAQRLRVGELCSGVRMGWFSILLLVLTLSSCHSSKKATKDSVDKTKPTTTVTTTTTTPSTKTNKDKQDPDLNKMKIAVGTNFTSKVRVTITQEGKDVTTNGNLRMRYGDVIQLTLVDPLLGVAEIGRLELSPNKVLIIDRVNRRYVDTTYDEFSALKSRNIDFNTIQEFFWQEAKKGDKFAYTIPAKRDIKLDLRLSNKGANSNWEPHTTVSGKYTKTDANQLFSSMLDK
jgi:hypothetical protein